MARSHSCPAASQMRNQVCAVEFENKIQTHHLTAWGGTRRWRICDFEANQKEQRRLESLSSRLFRLDFSSFIILSRCILCGYIHFLETDCFSILTLLIRTLEIDRVHVLGEHCSLHFASTDICTIEFNSTQVEVKSVRLFKYKIINSSLIVPMWQGSVTLLLRPLYFP